MLEKLKNKPIIINLDLDGLLSGLFLQKYLNCTVVGFSNSAETIWIKKSFSNFNTVCFVDLFVANKDTICLDQHIVSVNNKHHQILSKNENKINPNLMLQRTFLPTRSYARKYPFGTVHFLISLMEAEGLSIKLDLEKKIANVSLIDLILRADDCMKTTIESKYVENAKEWWKWLQKLSNNGNYTNAFIDYLKQLKLEESASIKMDIKRCLINEPFNCKTSDGGIDDILQSTNFLKDNVRDYFMFLSDFIEVDIFNWIDSYTKFKGIAKRTSMTKQQQENLISINTIDEKTVFSYAFVKSSTKQDNFSYTLFKTK